MANKRKQQAERTRSRIVEAMQKLIGEHGYENVTVDLIAEECSIGKGTLYHYFPSKDAIFTYISRDRFDESAQAIEQMEFASTEDKLRYYLADWFENVCADSVNSASAWYRFAVEHKLPSGNENTHFDDDMRRIERIIEEGRASGEFVESTPADSLASEITFAINGATLYRCISLDEFDLRAWGERYTGEFLAQLLAPYRARTAKPARA